MIVYRICKDRFTKDLNGTGAKLHGGRWNNTGTALLYSAESRSLCTLELAVHLPLGITPKNFKLVSIEIPDSSIKILKTAQLPKDWNTLPHGNATQEIGDLFVKENKVLVLKVPSTIVNQEYNYLVNPEHELFDKVKVRKVEEFSFDTRLFSF